MNMVMDGQDIRRRLARPRRRVVIASALMMKHPYEIALGIADYARRHTRWLMSTYVGPDQPESLEGLKSLGCNGIITGIGRVETLDWWRTLGIPIVNFTATASDWGFPQVVSDNAAIGRLIAEHFLKRGFRNFAFLGWSGHWWATERWRGFSETIRNAGHAEVASIWTVPPPLDRPQIPGERLAWEPWLLRLPKPVALMAASDELASAAAAICRRHRIGVPDDAAVVGVNNEPLVCEFTDPPLSSVAQDSRRIGYEAAALLDRLMSGQTPPSQPIQIPPLGLIARQSSETRKVEDPDVGEALRVIETLAGKLIGVDEIVARGRLHRRALERHFRKAVGHSVGAEIRQAHLRQAQRLLLETSAPVAQIALESGFRDAARFSVVFRRFSGLTPTQWRKRFRPH